MLFLRLRGQAVPKPLRRVLLVLDFSTNHGVTVCYGVSSLVLSCLTRFLIWVGIRLERELIPMLPSQAVLKILRRVLLVLGFPQIFVVTIIIISV